MPTAFTYAVGAAEAAFVLAGLFLIWRLFLSPRARTATHPMRLPAWDAPLTEFLFFLMAVMGTTFLVSSLALLASRQTGIQGDAKTVLTGAAAQFGMLAGAGMAFRVFARGTNAPPPSEHKSPGPILLSGVFTFVMALPILMLTGAIWEFALERLGLPVDRQDLIRMFSQADSPGLLAAMIGLAVIVAPVTEEIVFRAGLFRYLRTRMPRPLAILLPALFFASLHVDWGTLRGLASFAPLTVLAILFSLAYERTGRIGTPIVAHACINLNTIVIILSGLDS